MKINVKLMTLFSTIFVLTFIMYETLGSHKIENQKFDRLSISLDESIEEVQKHSTANLEIGSQKVDIRNFYAVTMATIVEYRDEKGGFILPPTILATVSTENNKVVDFITCPHMRLLNLADSKVLLKQLVQLFESKGWKINHKNIYPNIDELDFSDFDKGLTHDVGVRTWTMGDKDLILSIKRRVTKTDLKEHPNLFYSYMRNPVDDYYLIEVAMFKVKKG